MPPSVCDMINNTGTQSTHTTYNHATEGLIIVSQSVFFIVLFLIVKSYLLDNFGVMDNAETLRKNAVQVGAIYFAIIVFISFIMIPLYHYEYAVVVICGVLIGVAVVIHSDVQKTLKKKSGTTATGNMGIPPVKSVKPISSNNKPVPPKYTQSSQPSIEF